MTYVIFLGVTLFALVATLQKIDLYQRLDRGELVTLEEAQENDDLIGAVSGLQIVALLACAVTLMFWVHRANKNLQAINPQQARFTPGWAVGWFFVPVMNLFRPYQVVSEIARLSSPLGAGSALVGLWWAAWIISSLLDRAAAGALFGDPTPAESINLDRLANASMVISSAAAVLVMLIVRSVTTNQELRRQLAEDLLATPPGTPA